MSVLVVLGELVLLFHFWPLFFFFLFGPPNHIVIPWIKQPHGVLKPCHPASLFLVITLIKTTYWTYLISLALVFVFWVDLNEACGLAGL